MKALDKTILAVMSILAVAMIAYHMLYTQLVFLTPTQHQNLHLMFALALVYLWTMRKAQTRLGKAGSALLLALSLYATGYIFVEFEALETMRGAVGMLTIQDMAVGTLIVVLSLEASRRAFGLAFPCVAMLFIAYCYWGHNLPGMLRAPRIDYMEMINTFVMNLSGGVYGSTMGVSANYIFLFVVFGSFLAATGASDFFNRIGRAAGRRCAGGPAISSVVSSALMGSITGSALANVATTGTFTIPLMKKAGYRPEQAGAIEAAASTGGQIMPPVMGATAFVMAEMAGVPYVEVMSAAILPALLYFLAVAFYAQFQAKRLGINAESIIEGAGSARQILMEAPLFVGPLVLIMVLLFMGFSPMFTVFWAIVCLLGLNAAVCAKEGRLSSMLRQLAPDAMDGAVTGAKIAVTCAVLGPLVATLTKTSLGIRIPGIIAALCGGNLVLALLLTALVCIILGMGVPTIAAYMMVAMVGVPSLVNLGVPIFSAHMFVFTFAVFSCITPPVATAAIPAAGLAETSYMRTAVEASKVGCVGFIIPFFCVFAPELMLGQSGAGVGASIFFFLWVLVAAMCVSMAGCGWSVRRMNRLECALPLTVCGLMIVAVFWRTPWSYGVSLLGLALFLGREYLAYRRIANDSVSRAPAGA